MEKITLLPTNLLISRCHGAAVQAGWWADPDTGAFRDRNTGEMLALIHSEISEAAEGYYGDLMDTHLIERPMLAVELADAVIRVCDFAGRYNMDLGDTIDFIETSLRQQGASECDLLERFIVAVRKGTSNGGTIVTKGPFVETALVMLHMMISEALEADRKSNDQLLSGMLANFLIAVQVLSDRCGVPLAAVIDEKLAYNAQREDHKLEARKLAGGKKF